MILYRPVKWNRNTDWRFTQEYGANFKYNGKRFYGEIVKARKKHEGLDYAWPNPWDIVGIYASHDGKVVQSGYTSGRGHYIVVRTHDEKYETIYAHLSERWVEDFSTVTAKQQIGMMWTSGTSTAVHLHFGLRPTGGRWVDPTQYIEDWNVWYTEDAVEQAEPTLTTHEEPLIQQAIDLWYYNGEEGDGLTDRVVLFAMKLLWKKEVTIAPIEYGCACHDSLPTTADLSSDDGTVQTIVWEHILIPDSKGLFTYSVMNRAEEMNDHMSMIVLRSATRLIEKLTFWVLKFREMKAGSKTARIKVWYKRNGDEGLPVPFKSTTLGYGVAPTGNKYEGNLFMNEEFDWTLWASMFMVLKVLVHEIFHLFNIWHSSDSKDVMYSEYVNWYHKIIILQWVLNLINKLYKKTGL